MGPTGTLTETPARNRATVGGGLGNAVLFSIGQELRAAGSKTVYFAGYKKLVDRYKIDEIEKAADARSGAAMRPRLHAEPPARPQLRR
jgi:NAD(P)H-flavin reductase